jgi:hypothetical protein
MPTFAKTTKPVLFIIACLVLLVCAYLARGLFKHAATIHQLLTENKTLKKAITNLTAEDQIGYAKVIDQRRENGKLLTTIKFVETARDNKLNKILEVEYTIEGDVVHFDALIVKFGDNMVMDGRERALYLWRRIYDEGTPPKNAFPIESPGAEPQRYKDIFKFLPASDRNLFWTNIWDLANDAEKLASYDIRAVYGTAVYSKLRPGLLYVFKITPAGQLFPETIPDI